MQAWIKSKIDGTDPTSLVYVAAVCDPFEQQDILSKWATFCEDEGAIPDNELGVLWLATDALHDLPGLLDENAELLQKTQRLEDDLASLRSENAMLRKMQPVTLNGEAARSFALAAELSATKQQLAHMTGAYDTQVRVHDKLNRDYIAVRDELSALRADIEAGRLVRVPCQVGDKVYVIAKCSGVRRSLDGTMYSSDGSPGTATGYYCDYDEKWDECPLAAGRDECDEKSYAVFEDTVCQVAVVRDEFNDEPSVIVSLAHVMEYLDDKIYDTEQAARAAMEGDTE